MSIVPIILSLHFIADIQQIGWDALNRPEGNSCLLYRVLDLYVFDGDKFLISMGVPMIRVDPAGTASVSLLDRPGPARSCPGSPRPGQQLALIGQARPAASGPPGNAQ